MQRIPVLPQDYRISLGRATDLGIGVAHQFADEGKVEHAFEMAIEVTLRHQDVQGDKNWVVKMAGFRWSKHDRLRVANG